jgi:hypothetical protein
MNKVTIEEQRALAEIARSKLPRQGSLYRRLLNLGVEFIQNRKGQNIRVTTYTQLPANTGMRAPTGNRESARRARQLAR